MNPSKLGAIRCVTLATDQVEATQAAYTGHLGFHVVGDGIVSQAQAEHWHCPEERGSHFVLLQPASGVDFWLRVVESPAVPDYRPLTTYGWNASEYIVQNVDQLAVDLADSPFKELAPPADLSFSDAIRAMQVLGPANEVLYLTQFKRPVPEFDVPEALSAVDRVFISILGGESLDALQDFYHKSFGVARAPVLEAVISVMSDAYGLPSDQLHKLAALSLRGQCFIEADQCPEAAIERPCHPGRLPPGTAMVSFECTDAVSSGLSFDGPEYAGPAETRRGRAGELIELIETPSP